MYIFSWVSYKKPENAQAGLKKRLLMWRQAKVIFNHFHRWIELTWFQNNFELEHMEIKYTLINRN